MNRKIFIVRLGLAIFTVVVISYALMLGLNGPVYVDGKPVQNVKHVEDIGDEYLRQYPSDARVFADKTLEDKYIEKACVVDTRRSLFTLKFRRIDLHPQIMYIGKHNLSVEDAIRRACDEYNAKNQTKALDAAVRYDNKKRKYYLDQSVDGSYMDADALIEKYRNGERNIDFVTSRVMPKVTTDDLKNAVSEANQYLAWHVTYSKKKYTIRYPASMIAVSGSAVVVKDYDFHDELVHLDTLYNTAGQKHTTVLHNGKKYTTDKGTWGELTDSAKERKFLKKTFKAAHSIKDRKPVMKKRGSPLIIEVDKSKQHVWVYRKNGKVVMESPCVTGRKGVHDTPTGIFYISQVAHDYDMKGDDYVSHCQRFMRITNSGVALHDASWRYRFGGDIYKTNGSHGCINLPTAFALKLADKVKAGQTMVIVH